MRQTTWARISFIVLTTALGQVAGHANSSESVSVTGPGGNSKVGRYLYGTDRPALQAAREGERCVLKNSRIQTFDMRRDALWSFACPLSAGDEINGAFSPVNDLHHAGGIVIDMYRAYLGVDPVPLPIKLYAHDDGANAIWDGDKARFGDGDEKLYPWVTLDVVGHEIGHGFTERFSKLRIGGQSGGIYEAFSDMSGEAAEYFATGRTDFMFGDELVKEAGKLVLRDLCQPRRDGNSIEHRGDYVRGMNVSFSSGVYNKAFCVLAKTPGWTPKQAFQVFAVANMDYWTARENFNSGACGVESAAAKSGYRAQDVAEAFTEVGVRCEPLEPAAPARALANGVPITGLSADDEDEFQFTITLEQIATQLVVRTMGNDGDARLIVRRPGSQDPYPAPGDCSYNEDSNERCVLAPAQAGIYNVTVKADTTFDDLSVIAEWR